MYRYIPALAVYYMYKPLLSSWVYELVYRQVLDLCWLLTTCQYT